MMAGLDTDRALADVYRRWKAESKLEMQKAQWDKGIRDPKLKRKAMSIIARLQGRKFSIDALSHKHFDILPFYLVWAAKKQGYRLMEPITRYPWFVYTKTPTTASSGSGRIGKSI